MLAKNTRDKYRKCRKSSKCNKTPELKGKEAKKGPEMSAKMAKVTMIFHASWKHPQVAEKVAKKPRRAPKCPQISQKEQGFFLLAKNTHDKYRKNKKCNKIPDLEKKKRTQEGSRNVRKCRKNLKSNKDLSCYNQLQKDLIHFT